MPPPVWSVWIFYIDLKPPTAPRLQTESPDTSEVPFGTDINLKPPISTDTETNTPTNPLRIMPILAPMDHTVTPCFTTPDTHLGTSQTANENSLGGHLTSAALTGVCGPSSRPLPLAASEVSLGLLDAPLSSPTNSGTSGDVLHNGLPYITSGPNSPVSPTTSIDVLDRQDQTDTQQPPSPSHWAAQPPPTRHATCWERHKRLLQDGDI